MCGRYDNPQYHGRGRAVHVEPDRTNPSIAPAGPTSDTPEYHGRSLPITTRADSPTQNSKDIRGPSYDTPQYHGRSRAIHVRNPLTVFNPIPACRCCNQGGTAVADDFLGDCTDCVNLSDSSALWDSFDDRDTNPPGSGNYEWGDTSREHYPWSIVDLSGNPWPISPPPPVRAYVEGGIARIEMQPSSFQQARARISSGPMVGGNTDWSVVMRVQMDTVTGVVGETLPAQLEFWIGAAGVSQILALTNSHGEGVPPGKYFKLRFEYNNSLGVYRIRRWKDNDVEPIYVWDETIDLPTPPHLYSELFFGLTYTIPPGGDGSTFKGVHIDWMDVFTGTEITPYPPCNPNSVDFCGGSPNLTSDWRDRDPNYTWGLGHSINQNGSTSNGRTITSSDPGLDVPYSGWMARGPYLGIHGFDPRWSWGRIFYHIPAPAGATMARITGEVWSLYAQQQYGSGLDYGPASARPLHYFRFYRARPWGSYDSPDRPTDSPTWQLFAGPTAWIQEVLAQGSVRPSVISAAGPPNDPSTTAEAHTAYTFDCPIETGPEGSTGIWLVFGAWIEHDPDFNGDGDVAGTDTVMTFIFNNTYPGYPSTDIQTIPSMTTNFDTGAVQTTLASTSMFTDGYGSPASNSPFFNVEWLGTGTSSGGDCPPCDTCADPITGDPVLPFTPNYLPIHRQQIGDPTTTLDSYICTFEAGAMALDWQTRGAVQVWGGELIPWCGRSEGSIFGHGGNLGDIQQAWLHWGQNLDIRSGETFADMLVALGEGRGVILQGDYGALTKAEKCQKDFEGGHAIFVMPVKSGSYWLVGDPLCRDWHGIRESSLQDYAEALTGGSGILFAVTAAWAA